MNIKEIMIGNWVRPVGGGKPLIIASIHDFAFKTPMVELIHPFDRQIHKLAGLNEIEPIPLSEAMLERSNYSNEDNSCADSEAGVVHWYHKDRIGALEYPLVTYIRTCYTFTLVYLNNEVHGLKYVHELQNALNTVRRFDLAESIVVEERV